MTEMAAAADLTRHLPALLARARSLLGLPGGPVDRLGGREIAPAARAVLALHDGLINDRALARPETYDERAHLGAYLLWWWPQSYAKTRALLRLLPALPPRGRILDLGAGPGPAALAALDALGGEAVALDASGAALDEAKAIAGSARLAVRHWKLDGGGLPLAAGERFELITLANLLSELPGGPAERARLLTQIASEHLAPGGALLVLEPALRETGRALLEVRDLIVASGALRALAPCLTQRPCPALLATKDWCTAEERWTPPPHIVQLAQETGLKADELLSYAPLALAREVPAPPPGLFRVVGVPPPEKGKSRVFVCNDEHGRAAAVLLDRDAALPTAPLGQLRRGDLVTLRGLAQKGDGLRLGKDSEVVRLAPRADG